MNAKRGDLKIDPVARRNYPLAAFMTALHAD